VCAKHSRARWINPEVIKRFFLRIPRKFESSQTIIYSSVNSGNIGKEGNPLARTLTASRQCRLRSKTVLAPKASSVFKHPRCAVPRTSWRSPHGLRFWGLSGSVSDWPGSPRRAVGAAKYERRAIHLQRNGSSFEYPNQFQALAATGYRRRIRLDAVNKMPAGQS
jgi:hypothetical protein